MWLIVSLRFVQFFAESSRQMRLEQDKTKPYGLAPIFKATMSFLNAILFNLAQYVC